MRDGVGALVEAMLVRSVYAQRLYLAAEGTLDHYLRETVPSEAAWWDDPDRGVAKALRSD